MMKKLLIITVFACSFFISAYANSAGTTVYADVNGLVCDFCARALEKVFSRQDEVESIKVDLDNKVVTILFNESKQLDDKTITKLITDSGYNVRKLRHAK